MTLLYFFARTSFSSRARMIGAGKQMTIFMILITSVLRVVIQNSGEVMNALKCFNPAHSLP